MKRFHSNGKLLLTAEYFVLDGAFALALPTSKGQSMEVRETKGYGMLYWNAKKWNHELWFDAEIDLKDMYKKLNPISKQEQTLRKLLTFIIGQRPGFFSFSTDYYVNTWLEFPENWGWGSSSTFIYNLSQWANIDPYILLDNSLKGSGYDIACAGSNHPIFYQLKENKRQVIPTIFQPKFSNELFFVHLGKKQNSRDGIAHFKQKNISKKYIEEFSELTRQIALEIENIEEFSRLIEIHEKRVSEILDLPTVKSSIFPDCPFQLKSLGAWGGDFILSIGKGSKEYFVSKGFKNILGFDETFISIH